MEVIVDQDKCTAGGLCVMAAPEVFDQRDEDGIVVLLDANPPAGHHEAVRGAVMICPTAAIRLKEDR
jgi:ferredoxin